MENQCSIVNFSSLENSDKKILRQFLNDVPLRHRHGNNARLKSAWPSSSDRETSRQQVVLQSISISGQ